MIQQPVPAFGQQLIPAMPQQPAPPFMQQQPPISGLQQMLAFPQQSSSAFMQQQMPAFSQQPVPPFMQQPVPPFMQQPVPPSAPWQLSQQVQTASAMAGSMLPADGQDLEHAHKKRRPPAHGNPGGLGVPKKCGACKALGVVRLKSECTEHRHRRDSSSN